MESPPACEYTRGSLIDSRASIPRRRRRRRRAAMDLGLKGQAALVTGGSKGIGKAVARGLAQEGARVAICARGKESLEVAVKELAAATGAEVCGGAGELTRADDAERTVDESAARL